MPNVWRRASAAATVGIVSPVASAARPIDQHAVHLADQPETEWHPAAHAIDPVVERGDVARDLPHVVDRHAGRPLGLVLQEVREGAVRALDLLESTASLRT
jgi:hypothetical protein